MNRSRACRCVVAVALLLSVGCEPAGVVETGPDGGSTRTGPETATARPPLAAPSAPSEPRRTPTCEPGDGPAPASSVAPRDAVVLERFLAFALRPTPRRAAAVPLAARTRLGLGCRLVRSLGAGEVTRPRAWVLRPRSFRAGTGAFSALRLLRGHARTGAGFAMTVGEHRHCASGPVAAPAALEDARRLSLQPEGVDSCLGWFTVDLFVADGVVVAVTLDLWEP